MDLTQPTLQKENLRLLQSVSGKSGIYFISPEFPSDPHERFLVKIGLAVAKPYLGEKSKRGLKSRLESYLFCYPRGFYIFGLMFTDKDNALKMERRIHSYLAGKGRKADYPHSRVEEWYHLSLRDIFKTLHIHAYRNPLVSRMKVFVPPHRLTANPTAGKQKKVVPFTSPERFSLERRVTSMSPPKTQKKKTLRISRARTKLYQKSLFSADD